VCPTAEYFEFVIRANFLLQFIFLFVVILRVPLSLCEEVFAIFMGVTESTLLGAL
jgi:hypothetical protein